MYSVVLTELGISVFREGSVEKTFPFHDAVSEYLSVKKKESKLGGLAEYLAGLERGVRVSDESLLFLLKRSSIDAQIMEEAELEKIQETKPQIIVDSGFATDAADALGRLRDFSLGLSSSRITQVSQSPDLHIIQAIDTLDEIDKMTNILGSRLREWYGLHFPELENIIDGINGYAQIILAGKRDSLTDRVFEDAGFSESKAEMISLVASKSNGGDILDANLSIVQSIARQLLDFEALRKNLEGHVEGQMIALAPNLSAILGASVGARILGRAGSLQRLASMSASTVQVLGAEKALFRAIKTGSRPPKHGILFQHALVHAAPRWQRGKIARVIAAKAVIAARVDVYGEGLNSTLLEKLNVRVGEIEKKYEKPAKQDSRQEPPRRDGGFGRNRDKYSGGRERYSEKGRQSPKKKKRKRIGRR